MKDNQPFVTPRNVSNIADCDFYHVMDLPGYGRVGGQWDLRGRENAYLGQVAFHGKRVFELGTASGFLCWHMESQGASVVGFDLSSEHSLDLVPFSKVDVASRAAEMKTHIERLKNGWWFAHRLLGSKASAVYGDIYTAPKTIGSVDISTFGAILLHLRDPFQALFNVLQLTRETVIVTEVHPEQPVGSSMGSLVAPTPIRSFRRLVKRYLGLPIRGDTSDLTSHRGMLCFLPDYRSTDSNYAVTWWCFPPAVICEMLGVLGFERTTVTEHLQLFRGKEARMYTVVGSRTKPLPNVTCAG